MRSRLLKIFILGFIILLIGSWFQVPVKGYYCGVQSFSTDKFKYYINDKILVNASWDLFYNPSNEVCYIQVFIFDINGSVIWNSTKYNEIGTFNRNWSINLLDLNLTSFIFPSTVDITFYSYYYDMIMQREITEYKEILSIEINKRTLNSKIISPYNLSALEIEYGQPLHLTLKYTDSITNDTSLIANEKVRMEIVENNEILSYYDYLINSEGLAEIILDNFEILTVGNKTLRFLIDQNKFYTKNDFNITLIIKKTTAYCELISFNPILTENGLINFTVFTFYFLNNSIRKIENETLYIELKLNDNTIYSNHITINFTGFFNVVIYDEDLSAKPNNNENMTLMIKFEGNHYLESFSLELDINYIKENPVFNDSTNLLAYNIIIGFLIVFILIGIVKVRGKLNQPKKVEDLVLLY